MRALTDRFREGPWIRIEWLFALLVSSAFGYFVATGFWLGAAAVLALTAFVALVLIRPDAIALGWILGIPTLFVFANNAMMNLPFLTADRGVFLAAFGLLVARGLTQPGSLQPLGRVEKAMGLLLGIVLISWATTMPLRRKSISSALLRQRASPRIGVALT